MPDDLREGILEHKRTIIAAMDARDAEAFDPRSEPNYRVKVAQANDTLWALVAAPEKAIDTPAVMAEITARADATPEPEIEGSTDMMFLPWYEHVIAVVGDHTGLAWGAMLYSCTGHEGRGPRPVPPEWDEIVASAPDGYWDARGGVPKIVDGMFEAEPAASPCGYEAWIWMGVGVEGPEALKERGATIPSPFGAGLCPGCGKGALLHTHWSRDETFATLRAFPDGIGRFVVPSIEKARELADRNYGGADYIAAG